MRVTNGRRDVPELQQAFQDSWTLCGTLQSMGAHHREDLYGRSTNPETARTIFNLCWELCKAMYQSNDIQSDSPAHLDHLLQSARDLEHALSANEPDKNEADSLRRVTMVLNDHLHGGLAPELPDTFQQRTLEIYLDLCGQAIHSTSILTGDLLIHVRTCWALVETLYTLRRHQAREAQGAREDELGAATLLKAEEDLLTHAISTCFNLCTLFHNSWHEIQRGHATPRASLVGPDYFRSQPNLGHNDHSHAASLASARAFTHKHAFSGTTEPRTPSARPSHEQDLPETPATVFEDLEGIDPMEEYGESLLPKIILLGPRGSVGGGVSLWPPSASRAGSMSGSFRSEPERGRNKKERSRERGSGTKDKEEKSRRKKRDKEREKLV